MRGNDGRRIVVAAAFALASAGLTAFIHPTPAIAHDAAREVHLASHTLRSILTALDPVPECPLRQAMPVARAMFSIAQ